MRFEELNWFDVESYLEKDDRLMLVLGACEQHGYLSLATDVKIPQSLADAASQQTSVLVAPAINYGASPYFLGFPGTLSLRLSAFEHGFRRILVLNGHGGNDGVRSRLYELSNELDELRIAWYAWWESHSVSQIAQLHDLKPAHANWLEAFPFTRVSDLPEGEKVPPKVAGLLSAQQARKVYGNGVFGGPYETDQSIMDEIFSAALEDIFMLLRFE